MRSVLLLVPEVGPGPGPDLSRYLAVSGLSVLALLGLAWCLRRFAARHLRARAARRSLQVLDVLPLGGKHKLLVVRCHDRSFLLGVGEKEVRSIAELDGTVPPPPASDASSFAEALDTELVVPPPAPRPAPEPRELEPEPRAMKRGGLLA